MPAYSPGQLAAALPDLAAASRLRRRQVGGSRLQQVQRLRAPRLWLVRAARSGSSGGVCQACQVEAQSLPAGSSSRVES